MLRYEVQMKKAGAILKTNGLAHSIVAPQGTKALIVVYVNDADARKFETLISGEPLIERTVRHDLSKPNPHGVVV